MYLGCVPVTGFYRYGEEWKRKRTAIGKQTLPRIVQSYIPGMNSIISNFVDYMRASRNEDEMIDDIAIPTRMLLVECMTVMFVIN